MERLSVIAKHLTAGVEVDRQPLITTRAEYDRLYQWSITDPASFWSHMATDYYWKTQWDPKNVCSFNFDVDAGPIHSEWFKGGTTNMSYNCLDRWVAEGRGNQVCLMWEGNNPGHERAMTYSQVLAEVCRLANWLRSEGVHKGDTVVLYLPMICTLPVAMLACTRIGAVHSVVFAGFSAEALAQRVVDCGARVLITASGVVRGTKTVELKKIVDAALDICTQQGHQVSRVLVYEKDAVAREVAPWHPGRDVWWRRVVPNCSDICPPEWCDAEDRLFMLYTSGSTGKPKGVVHTTGGYMVQAGVASKYLLDIRPGDVYWCTADIGWITGHTYLVYGPMLCGATVVLFGATPTYPDASRCWRVVQRYKVRQFYTAPTLVRSLLQHGDSWVKASDRSSLKVVGEGRCPLIDEWWQTETGSAMISPFPGSWCTLKPGAASLPFFGVQPVLLDGEGREVQGPGEGVLALKGAWPAMFRTLHGDHARFETTYFAPYKGYYFTGDGARRDADGYYWITGRVDDVINVSGHRIGTAELEAALTAHEQCAEAAVVGVNHSLKGQGIYAYVTLTDGSRQDEAMKKVLSDHVRQVIGAFAVPDAIHWAPSLPKTRSGKVMRRLLRKIATGEVDDLGDISTLAEPAVVEQLISLKGQ